MSASIPVRSYADYRGAAYLPALDGLRALAVLLVLSVHLGDNILHDAWSWLSGSGGVAIFFALSGYLITMLALREEEERGRLCLKAFYVRRTFRIFPLYYYVIGIAALLISSSGSDGGRAAFHAALPYYLTYMGEFAPTAQLYHAWSLGIEEKFYLVWPLLAFVLLKSSRDKRLWIALALALAAPVTPGVRSWIHWYDYSRIAMGCAVALALHDPRLYARLTPLARGAGLYAGLAAFLATHFVSGHGFRADNSWIEGLYTIAIAWALLGLLVADPPWARLLSTRPLRWMGRRAYALYLVHVACIWVAEIFFPAGSGDPLRMVGAYGAALLLSLLVAEILFRVVERPMMIVGKRLSDRILADAAPPAAIPQDAPRAAARAAGAS